MPVFLTSFWLPKSGNTEAEYEDSFFPRIKGELVLNPLRVAVADGASEGILSRQWADILVQTFCGFSSKTTDFNGVIERALTAWAVWKSSYLDERERQGRPIQWYEEPGLQAGSFASLLGLVIRGAKTARRGQWEAVALGDSCLFQVRGERLMAAFPIGKSSDFNNRPLLLSSNRHRNEGALKAIGLQRGGWQRGDSFYLMTDALAAWFMRECEENRSPWRVLSDLDSIDELQPFEEWVRGLRMRNQMRNDDVTLIRLEL